MQRQDNTSNILFKNAVNAFNQNNFSEAVNYCEQSLTQAPNFAEPYHLLGIIAYKNGCYENAIELVKKACELTPENATFHNSLGNIFSKIGDIDNALFAYKTAIKLADRSIDPYINMAVAINDFGDFKKAIELLDTALLHNLSDERILFTKANILQKNLQFRESEDVYRCLLDRNPDHEASIVNLGTILTNTKREDEAQTLYTNAVIRGLATPNIIFNLGYIFQQKKIVSEAKHFYQQVIAIDSSFDKAKTNLGTLCFEEGLFTEAIDLFSQVTDSSKSFIDAKHNLIMCHQASQKLEDMREEIEINLANNIDHKNIAIELKIHLSIYHWLKNNMRACEALLVTLAEHIKKQSSTLNAFTRGYYSYLLSLVNTFNPQYYLPSTITNKTIYAIGDSHALALANLRIPTPDENYLISTQLVVGAKMWHLANTERNKFKSSVEVSLNNIPKGATVMLLFGEIDCRINEGIIRQLENTDKDISHITSPLVNSYLDFVKSRTSERKLKIIICGIPATNKNRKHYDDEKFNHLLLIIKQLNYDLMTQSKEYNFKTIDTYSNTICNSGASNGSHHVDDCHLSPAYWFNLLQSYDFQN